MGTRSGSWLIKTMLTLAMAGTFLPVQKVLAVDCVNNASTQYRSQATGNWGIPATWECSDDGTNWQTPTTNTPTSSNGVITIRTGHTVTIESTVTVDEVTVENGGQLTVGSGVAWTLANGSATPDLTISGILLNQGSTWTTTGTWAVGTGGTFIHNTNSGISQPLNDATLDAGSFFIYRGPPSPIVSVANRNYGNLSFESTSETWSRPLSGGTATVQGDFTLGNGVTLGSSTFAGFTLYGDWTNNGTYNAGIDTVTFNGSSAQTIGGTSSTAFNNLTINNSSTIANGVNLGTAQTVNGTLTLTTGFLKLNANNLTLGTSATIAGTPSASNMVVADGTGYLKKASGGSFSAFVFPIGDNSGNYTPVTLNCPAFTSGQSAGFSVTNTKHPNMNSSSHLTRHWTLSTAAATPTCTNVIFQYMQGDVAGIESEIRPVKWNGSSPWYPLTNAAINSSNDTLSGDFSTITDGQAVFSGGVPGTLSVQLERFDAMVETDHILLRWETVNEVDNQGFYLYRALDPNGPWTQITPRLIPSQSPGSPWGFVYEWTDRDVVFGERYVYRLASMDMAGLAEVVDTTEAQFGVWQQVWLPMVGR